jgi:DnaA family protein
MTILQQSILKLKPRDDFDFANFYTGANSELIINLINSAKHQGEQFIYLWGTLGTGRSHLLQACCNMAKQHQNSTIYLALSLPNLTPNILENLEHTSLTCIDDINSVIGNSEWEIAIFNLFNNLMELKNHLIIASDCAPNAINCHLKDLKSRLGSGTTYQVQALTDDQKILAMQMRCKNRGLTLPENVSRYLLNNCQRDMHALFNLLDKIYQTSFIQQHQLTIPFIKKVLDDIF